MPEKKSTEDTSPAQEFRCGSCGLRYPWSSLHAGRVLPCMCGNTIEVPPSAGGMGAVRGRGEKGEGEVPVPLLPCPRCRALLEGVATVCVKCGYDFRTGTTSRTRVHDRKARTPVERYAKSPSGRWYELKQYVIPMMLIVAGAGCGCMTASHFGVGEGITERMEWVLKYMAVKTGLIYVGLCFLRFVFDTTSQSMVNWMVKAGAYAGLGLMTDCAMTYYVPDMSLFVGAALRLPLAYMFLRVFLDGDGWESLIGVMFLFIAEYSLEVASVIGLGRLL